MAKIKPPKRLFKTEDRASSFEQDHTKSSGKRMKFMTRDHEDILQNIEFAIVTQYREDQGIDDHHIDQALSTLLEGGKPTDRRVADIVEAIEKVRSMRDDVDDELWRTGLMTVRDSVRRHSDRKPRERGYLDFVKSYIH